MTDQPPIDDPVVVTEKHRDAVAVWRLMVKVLGAALFAVVALAAYGEYLDSRNAREAEAVSNCRSRLTTAVQEAEAAQDIAEDDVVIGLAVNAGELAPSPDDRTISEAGEALREARVFRRAAVDARKSYDENPDQPCPTP